MRNYIKPGLLLLTRQLTLGVYLKKVAKDVITTKHTYTIQKLDERGTPVLIDKKDDVWYTLYFDEDTNKIILRYQERHVPIKYRYNIDRVIQSTYKNSTVRKVLSQAINNYKEHNVYREEPYKGSKIVTVKNDDLDLTDISNNMKNLPKELRKIIFRVSEKGHKLTIHSMVTQHDVEKHRLNTKVINTKLEKLESFKGDDAFRSLDIK